MQVYQHYNSKPLEKYVWIEIDSHNRYVYDIYKNGQYDRTIMVYSRIRMKDKIKKSFLTKKGKELYLQSYFSDDEQITIGKLCLRWGDTGSKQRPQRWVTLSDHPWNGLISIISLKHELEIDWQKNEILRCFNILKLSKMLNLQKCNKL